MRAPVACIALACLCCGAGQKKAPERSQGAAGTARAAGKSFCFHRVAEPRENAFTILVPAGWRTAGGIVRVNPMAGGGAGNAIAAKVDFAVQSDQPGSVMLRALPEMMYADMRRSPAAPMFPPGSNYNGMTVMPMMDAATFLAQVAFPYAHPRAAAPRVSERRSLPQVASQYAARLRAFGVPPRSATTPP